VDCNVNAIAVPEETMRRRNFILSFLLSSILWPQALRGEQPKVPKVGVLVPANAEPFWSEFRVGLRELNYIEGKNIAFEFRSADGVPSRLRALADDLVRLKVDLIVASLTPAINAARQATSDIPIVMASGADPVLTGLISSLARPGGNITGVSGAASERYVKVLELIRELLPKAQRVAILVNAGSQFASPLVERMEAAAQTLSFATQVLRVRGVEDFEGAFAAMDKERAEVAIMQASLPRQPALDFSLKHRLPFVGPDRLLAEEGGLMSYAANDEDRFRRAASFVDRILKGAKPAELPVEQPTRYELVINLKAAQVLGVTVPPALLARADRVIE
jgi:putative ABC transport system substrate-binding protein